MKAVWTVIASFAVYVWTALLVGGWFGIMYVAATWAADIRPLTTQQLRLG